MACPYFTFSRVPLPASTTVTSASVHARFLAVGTSAGSVLLVDYAGAERCRWQTHAARVSGVCVDDSGEFVASASEDGTVVVRPTGVSAGDATEAASPPAVESGGDGRVVVAHHRPVLAIALAADYASSTSSRALVTGGESGRH